MAGSPIRAPSDSGWAVEVNSAVANWGSAQGKQHVVLGGGYSGEDGLLRYKQRYAPNGSVLFSVGSKIFDHDAYHALIETRVAWEFQQGRHWAPSCDFFPAYRG